MCSRLLSFHILDERCKAQSGDRVDVLPTGADANIMQTATCHWLQNMPIVEMSFCMPCNRAKSLHVNHFASHSMLTLYMTTLVRAIYVNTILEECLGLARVLSIEQARRYTRLERPPPSIPRKTSNVVPTWVQPAFGSPRALSRSRTRHSRLGSVGNHLNRQGSRSRVCASPDKRFGSIQSP